MRLFPKSRASIRREAADWLVRIDSDPTPENNERFRRWRNVHPRNEEEARKAENILRESALLHGSTFAPDRGLSQRGAPPRQSPRLLLAASFGATLIFAPAIYVILSHTVFRASRIEAVMLTTDIGEIRKVELADGSTVTLDTASAVRVDLAGDHRSAVLERGRARFAIANAAVPFSLKTGSDAILINEGVADLSRLDEGPRIELVSQNAQLVANAAQDREAVPSAQASTVGAPKIDWTSGRLSFAGARLADVIIAANRYTRHKIVVDDPAVQELRVTGVFRTGDADVLAGSLAAAFGLRTATDAVGNIHLQRSNAKISGASRIEAHSTKIGLTRPLVERRIVSSSISNISPPELTG